VPQKPAEPTRTLCAPGDLQPGTATGFDGGLFAIRVADCIKIYVNACPHLGVPLDWLPGKFLSADGRRIVCAMHGAEFRPEDGVCERGPCRGESLTQVAFEVRDGLIMVPAEAGSCQGRENPADETREF
jgi:nitrite reductase/ring-hydroxylating ferredoxin subunit